MGFAASGYVSEKQFRRERREEIAARARAVARRVAAIAQAPDDAKLKILARAIYNAVRERASIQLADLTQSGVSKADAERLYDQAFELARETWPALDTMGAMP